MTTILQQNLKIIEYIQYTPSVFALKIFSPEIVHNSVPGQFVMIRDKHWSSDPLLGRPMSIARVDKKEEWFELQILITGKGTRLLAELRQNDYLEVIGPLGNQFSEYKPAERIALVAGGIGVAPLIYFDEFYRPANRLFFYGAASEKDLIPSRYLSDDIIFSTDDGSHGVKGFVTDPLLAEVKNKTVSKIYACGPTPMLQTVQKIAREYKIKAELSVETEMACGFGLCLGCVIPKQDNPQQYVLACKDGPVFKAQDIKL